MTGEPQPSVVALMKGLIDYAGLFPPAALPMGDAARHYAKHRCDPHSWILARFICPATRLVELVSFETCLQEGKPWPLSILGRGGDEAGAFLSSMKEDCVAVGTVTERLGDRLQADAFEVRLPSAIVADDSSAVTTGFLRSVRQTLAHSPTGPLSLFLEIPIRDAWRETLDHCIQAVAEVDAGWVGADGSSIGVKIRTGGVEPSAFPSVEQVAYWIACCARHGVPFKATAGLHHPVRHFSIEVGAKMHGFLNVFTAAVWAWKNRTSPSNPAELAAILADEAPESFRLTPHGVQWRNLQMTLAEIQEARTSFALSYGSCSFLEPIEDLQSLNLL